MVPVAADVGVPVEGGAPGLAFEVVTADDAGRAAVVVGVPALAADREADDRADGDAAADDGADGETAAGEPAAFAAGVITGADLAAARAHLRALGPKAGTAGAVHELLRPGSTPERLLFLGTGPLAAGSAGPAGSPGPAATTPATLAALRRGGAALARAAKDAPVLTLWAGHAGRELTAVVEGLALGSYRFPAGSHTPAPALSRVEVVGGDAEPSGPTAAAVAAGLRSAAATAWARDLTNTRASTKSPQWVAERAVDLLTPLGVQVDVRDVDWLAEHGFGGVLAVGGGSDRRPRLVEAHYRPAGADGPPVLVVGKGIVYDTGGYNLKPGTSMATMYTDMAGGAAALAALAAVAAAGLALPVSVLVPLADNVVSAQAYRPGDVVVHHGGRTSEITNTDAEGRLVLGDALAYGVATLAPRLVVDIATLTGAMSAALGPKIAGIIGDDQDFVDALVAAGAATGERLWQLPLGTQEYASDLDSPVADAVNSVGSPPAAITAALFLRPFAGGVPWAHLDIAGTARAKADDGPLVKGATGFGTRLLARWLTDLA